MGGTAGTADTEAGGNKNMINVPIKIEIKDNNLHSNSSNSMKTDSFLSQNIKDEKEKEVRRALETFFKMFYRIFFLSPASVCRGGQQQEGSHHHSHLRQKPRQLFIHQLSGVNIFISWWKIYQMKNHHNIPDKNNFLTTFLMNKVWILFYTFDKPCHNIHLIVRALTL